MRWVLHFRRKIMGVEKLVSPPSTKKRTKKEPPFWGRPFIYLVPRARIELARAQGPRDFKSRVSTNSTIQASGLLLPYRHKTCQS